MKDNMEPLTNKEIFKDILLDFKNAFKDLFNLIVVIVKGCSDDK